MSSVKLEIGSASSASSHCQISVRLLTQSYTEKLMATKPKDIHVPSGTSLSEVVEKYRVQLELTDDKITEVWPQPGKQGSAYDINGFNILKDHIFYLLVSKSASPSIARSASLQTNWKKLYEDEKKKVNDLNLQIQHLMNNNTNQNNTTATNNRSTSSSPSMPPLSPISPIASVSTTPPLLSASIPIVQSNNNTYNSGINGNNYGNIASVGSNNRASVKTQNVNDEQSNPLAVSSAKTAIGKIENLLLNLTKLVKQLPASDPKISWLENNLQQIVDNLG